MRSQLLSRANTRSCEAQNPKSTLANFYTVTTFYRYQTDRHRKTDKQTGRQIDRQIDGRTDRLVDRQSLRDAYRQRLRQNRLIETKACFPTDTTGQQIEVDVGHCRRRCGGRKKQMKKHDIQRLMRENPDMDPITVSVWSSRRFPVWFTGSNYFSCVTFHVYFLLETP